MIVKAWLEAEFEGGRHANRVEMISQIEAEPTVTVPAQPKSKDQPSDGALTQTRIKIAETGKMVFGRHLTDAAGGNISVRVGDKVCITPRYSGSRRHWQLQPNQVLVSDLLGNKFDGDGDISRESKVHYRLYKEFPDGTAVLHSHPRHVMVFVASGQPIEPVLEATLKFGTIPMVKSYAPAHSEKLADRIAEAMQGKAEAIRKYAVAVMAPWHGLFVVGKDLRADGNLDHQVAAAGTGLVGARSPLAPRRTEVLGVTKVDEGVEAGHGFEDDISALSAVAAIGPAELDELLAAEAYCSRAASARAHEDFGLVQKMHDGVAR